MTEPANRPAAPASPPPVAPPSPPEPATPPAPLPPAGPSAVDDIVSRYGTSQLLVALGALIVIVADVVFVIFGPYGYSTVVWACAAAALATVVLRTWLPRPIAENSGTVIFVVAGLAVLVSARELIDDLSFLSGANVAPTYFLGMLAIYAGVALMAVGAWRLNRGQR